MPSGTFLSPSRAFLDVLERFWGLLPSGTFLSTSRGFWGVLEPSLGLPGHSWALWDFLGPSGTFLCPSGTFLGPSGTFLGPSVSLLGSILYHTIPYQTILYYTLYDEVVLYSIYWLISIDMYMINLTFHRNYQWLHRRQLRLHAGTFLERIQRNPSC